MVALAIGISTCGKKCGAPQLTHCHTYPFLPAADALHVQALYKDVRQALQAYYVKQAVPVAKAAHKGLSPAAAPPAQWCAF